MKHVPNFIRLEVPLLGQLIVYFQEGFEKEGLRYRADKRTKLKSWFIASRDYPNARHIR